MTQPDEDYNGAPQPPVAALKVTRLSDDAVTMFKKAFEQFGRGEMITWEIGIQALPSPPEDPNGERDANGNLLPKWETMLVLYAEIRGIVPGTSIFRGFPLMPHAWTQDKADVTVQQVLRALLEGRTRQLEAMEQEAQGAMKNGNPAPAHGLIIPGR